MADVTMTALGMVETKGLVGAIEAADKIILMIDHSKFEKTAVFSVADLSLFDYIVSDKLLSPQEQSRMESEYGLRWLHAV